MNSDVTNFELLPIPQDGSLPTRPALHPIAGDICRHMAASYRRTGYREPWIGYLTFADGVNVGTCAFKGPPEDGRVEIAYFTFRGFERRGHAGRAAAALVKLAETSEEAPEIMAQTLPKPGASTRILTGLGFTNIGSVEHPEDGPVWEWVLPR
jgi:[ribosomal protein S5]-alanine N-acetyltransferase